MKKGKYKIKLKKGTIIHLAGLPYELNKDTIIYGGTYPVGLRGIKKIWEISPESYLERATRIIEEN